MPNTEEILQTLNVKLLIYKNDLRQLNGALHDAEAAAAAPGTLYTREDYTDLIIGLKHRIEETKAEIAELESELVKVLKTITRP